MSFHKKCLICAKTAMFKFVRLEEGQLYDIYYCAIHAEERSPYLKAKPAKTENTSPPPTKKHQKVGDVLAGLLAPELAAHVGEIAEAEPRCATCGFAFHFYRKTHLLGCADCYNSFSEQLLTEVRRCQFGNERHIGRGPGGEQSPVPAEAIVAAHVKSGALGAEINVLGSATGLSPAQAPKELIKAIASLTALMNQAIAREDFEVAARHRDQIKELRGKIGK